MSQAKLKGQEASAWTRKVYYILHGNASTEESDLERSYYVATIGNVTEEAIKKYITEQSEQSRKEDNEGAAL